MWYQYASWRTRCVKDNLCFAIGRLSRKKSMNEIRMGSTRRRIKRRLHKKITAWIKSIDNKGLRELAQKDTIVTGGSIASMFLGERVNDFDVYFRTIGTAKAMAEYYLEKMGFAGDGEVRIETLENIKGEEEDRVVIFIPSEGIEGQRDTDEDEDDDGAPVFEVEEKGEYRPVFLSENAVTLSDSVQLVTRFYGEPDDIHDNYDFIHACNYYDYYSDELETKSEALECLLARKLRYVGSLYPIASLFRIRKFMSRGWRINAGDLLKIAWQISEIDLTDPVILREQLTGVDQAYFEHVIKILERDLSAEKITSSYVGEVIDRVFND